MQPDAIARYVESHNARSKQFSAKMAASVDANRSKLIGGANRSVNIAYSNCESNVGGANPFDSAAAREHSSYAGYFGGSLVRLLDNRPVSAFARTAHDAFRRFVGEPDFSCLGAKSAINRGAYRSAAYHSLENADVTQGLARDLYAFVQERASFGGNFTTFVATFAQPRFAGERDFEIALWAMLQRLHEVDRIYHAWDPRVASNPADPNFSFSFAGTGFFIVGLSPTAARTARRFAYPTLIFNAHEQFEALREAGRFAGLQQQIRQREHKLDGSLNPNLATFGEASESRQYSGRAVEDDWKCPFITRR